MALGILGADSQCGVAQDHDACVFYMGATVHDVALINEAKQVLFLGSILSHSAILIIPMHSLAENCARWLLQKTIRCW